MNQPCGCGALYQYGYWIPWAHMPNALPNRIPQDSTFLQKQVILPRMMRPEKMPTFRCFRLHQDPTSAPSWWCIYSLESREVSNYYWSKHSLFFFSYFLSPKRNDWDEAELPHLSCKMPYLKQLLSAAQPHSSVIKMSSNLKPGNRSNGAALIEKT